MTMTFQQLIYWIDCSEGAVNNRRQIVRMLLNGYKSGQATPERREMLIETMKKFKVMAASNKAMKDQYNALTCYYFADKPLSPNQMAVNFHITKETVFRHIKSGIETLTILLYGIGGVCFLPMGESDSTGSGQEDSGTRAAE